MRNRHGLLLILLAGLSACHTPRDTRGSSLTASRLVSEWTGFIRGVTNDETVRDIFIFDYGGIEQGLCLPSTAAGPKLSLVRDMPWAQWRRFNRSFDRSQSYDRFRLFEVKVTGRRIPEPSEYFYLNAHIGVPYDERVELIEPIEFTGRSCRIDFRTPQEKAADIDKGSDVPTPDPSNSFDKD